MATSAISTKPKRTPLQKAARTANVWGWSLIITILGAFGAGYVEPGPLRVLLLNFGILCFAIGILELFLRHKLLKTGEARWVKMLALNQVGGTLALLWSLYLLYEVPEQVFLDYCKHSDLWNSVQPLIKALDVSHKASDTFYLHMWHITKLIGIYGVGGALLISQVWVIWHYLAIARQMEASPAPSVGGVPPVLKK